MSRNTMIALVALMLVGLVGLGGAYWAYKKYKQKQNQEFMYRGTMGKPREGFDAVAFKDSVLTDGVLAELSKKHQLVSKWAMSEEEVKERIRSKFRVTVAEGVVSVSYQDKDKEIARTLLEDIVKTYYVRLQPSYRAPAR